MIITHFRLGNNGIPPTPENMEKLEFWGMKPNGKEVRLYYFDEDNLPPNGYSPISPESGIMPVTFFVKDEEVA